MRLVCRRSDFPRSPYQSTVRGQVTLNRGGDFLGPLDNGLNPQTQVGRLLTR
jgi:hypothetical protein